MNDFDGPAAPVRAFAAGLSRRKSAQVGALATDADRLLASYEMALRDAGAPEHFADTARYGLAVVIDSAVRRVPQVSPSAWGALAEARLGRGERLSVERLTALAQRASSLGPEYEGLAAFLRGCLRDVGASGPAAASRRGGAFAALGLAVALCIGAVALAFVVSQIQHRRAVADAARVFEAEIAAAQTPAALLAVLGELRGVASREAPERALSAAPASAVAAQKVTAGALEAAGGALFGQLLEAAFDSDGTSEGNYAHLRVWAMASGAQPWERSFVEAISPRFAINTVALPKVMTPPQKAPCLH